MENANQFAMIVVYWIVGTVAGVLVNLETQERERRLKAEREAIIQGIAVTCPLFPHTGSYDVLALLGF
jgi:hypothetical protein